MSKSIDRYSGFGRGLHWLTAILVLVAFVYGPGGPEDRVYSPAVDFDRRLHETLGLTVFGLALLRVIWRMVARVPVADADAPAWMQRSSVIVQRGLYLLLFAVPLTAICGAWLGDHPLGLLAGVDLASMIGTSPELGRNLAELHGWLGDVLLWLAGLHAAAALFHHFVLRDGVLASMLPGQGSHG